MKQFALSVITVLFFSGLLITTHVFADNQAALLKQANSLVKRAPTNKELKRLLVGNTLCYERQTTTSSTERCYYYLASGKLNSTDGYQDSMTREWSVKSDGRYCHQNIRRKELCYDGIRVRVKGGKIQVIMVRMSGRKKGEPIEYTLFLGEKSA